MLIIKYGYLGSVPQLQLFQNGAEVIAHRSLTEEKLRRNLLIAAPVGDQPDDLKLPFIDVIASMRSSGSLEVIWVPNTVCPESTARMAGRMLP